ncbi:hypothetical protein IM792_12335 [Mucilaginibacter sp. JRF]|uniref:hypothetical protein n=1 Tax=Mucilaginibacter sp. JRF TaxID=2780088 RepID=UPI0018830EE3|nr:hypothetical protein [Mucilaginibacter sp. JRF]MBE9585240.1 hypothetical protein [Mucilaginibacter sp. JRF]
MKTDKHYKFINSGTGYCIFHYSLSSNLTPEQINIELEKVKAQVASNNGLLLNTIYWEEVRDDN